MKEQTTIDREISRIYERDGKVVPSVVVAESRPKDAALHGYFQWNNAKAGAEFRLIQARNIIRKAKVIAPDLPEPVKLHHVPVIAKEAKEGFYKPATDIHDNPDEYMLALEEIMSALRAAQRRLKDFEKETEKRGADSDVAKIGVAFKALEAAESAMRTLQ